MKQNASSHPPVTEKQNEEFKAKNPAHNWSEKRCVEDIRHYSLSPTANLTPCILLVQLQEIK